MQAGEEVTWLRSDLAHKGLTALPPEIGQLTELTKLDLSNNQLTALPPEIGQLPALTKLWLHNNQLTTLPETLRGHRALRYLFLHGNPALGLPPEVLGPDPRDEPFAKNCPPLLDYYFSMQQGARPLNEVKLLLIGRGGAGKTATMNRLLGRGFIPGTGETQGIEITDFDLPCPRKETVRVHGWDFAGQTVTHGLHKFFLSHRSIYILVLSGREESAQEDAEYWLKLMEAYAGLKRTLIISDKKYRDDEMPPVVIALNKWESGDARPILDKQGLEEKYPCIAGWVETDAKTGLGYEHGKKLLPAQLSDLAGKMEWVHAPFPAAWHKAKEHFSRMKQETGEDYLPYTSFQQQAVKLGVPEDKVKSLVEILHRLGIALNYGDRLGDTTVLNPHWVTGTIYKVLREAPRPDDAVMTLEHVAEVLPEEPPAIRAFVVELMRRFDLAFPLPDRESHWLVPARLPEAQPAGVKEEFGPEVEGATRLRFTVNPLPRMILPSFVTRTHILSDDLAKVRWANGAVLELGNAKALVKADHADRTVTVTLIGERKDRPTLASVCRRELAELFKEIPGLNPKEELEVRPGVWAEVALLELEERDGGTEAKVVFEKSETKKQMLLRVKVRDELDKISPREVRDDTIWKPTVFISYSHKEERYKDELVQRFKILQAAGLAGEVWTDRMLEPGEKWDSRIIQELERADMVLLLVSNASLASDYIQRKEMKTALARNAAGTAVVVPVILERCQWKDFKELASLQALPKDAKPLREWKPSRNVGWFHVMEALKEKIKAMQSERK
jgi:internalin A